MIPTEDDVREAVQQINDKLKVVDQCLKFVHFEVDNGHVESLVFVNQIETAVLKYVQDTLVLNQCTRENNLLNLIGSKAHTAKANATTLRI